ncbi:MAG TPA: methyltransferase domain-containing protein [Actinomycetota bacterium]|nr:methyltransferase domain-containing protein [Actinomycetota bacterium]
MLADVVDDLVCSLCGAEVSLDGRTVRCSAGHSFDVARHGYVSMLVGRGPRTGDTAEMVGARRRFLGAGHYSPLRDAVVAACAGAPPGCVVDVGAGTGYYLAAVLTAPPDRTGIALDSSPAALRVAARCHSRVGAVACDAWSGLPVRTSAAGVVLNVFAPRNGAEMHRVLAPDGVLVVVTPTDAHLRELVAAPGLVSVDAAKERRVEEALGPWFDETSSVVVDHEMSLSRAEACDALAMGPSARHVVPDPAALPERVRVRASARVTTYCPRP